MKALEHNGKKYTNADAWRTAKATSKPQAGPMPAHEQQPSYKASPVMGAQAATAEGEDPLEGDGTAIAQEHGPATEVHVEHESELGAHHVHSVHPDGHEHHSDHETAAKAHEHAAKLAMAHEEQPDNEGTDDWSADGY